MPPGATAEGDIGFVVGDDSLVHEAQVERHAAVDAVGARPRRVAATLDGEGTVARAVRLSRGTFGKGLDGKGNVVGGQRTENAGSGQLGAGSPTVRPQLILVVVGVDDLVGVDLAELLALDTTLSAPALEVRTRQKGVDIRRKPRSQQGEGEGEGWPTRRRPWPRPRQRSRKSASWDETEAEVRQCRCDERECKEERKGRWTDA